MELKKVEGTLKDLLKHCTYSRSDNMLTIENFMLSDMEVAEVTLPPEKRGKAGQTASSLTNTCKRMHVGAKAFSREGKVYLVKTTV